LESAGGVVEETGCDVGDGVAWCLDEISGEFVKSEGLEDLWKISEIFSQLLTVSEMKAYRWKEILEALSINEREVHSTEQPS